MVDGASGGMFGNWEPPSIVWSSPLFPGQSAHIIVTLDGLAGGSNVIGFDGTVFLFVAATPALPTWAVIALVLTSLLALALIVRRKAARAPG
jgi:hypothetical protein